MSGIIKIYLEYWQPCLRAKKRASDQASSVMVFGLVASDGKNGPGVYSSKRRCKHGGLYWDFMYVLPWIKEQYDPNLNVVFQQNSDVVAGTSGVLDEGYVAALQCLCQDAS